MFESPAALAESGNELGIQAQGADEDRSGERGHGGLVRVEKN